MGQLAVVNVDCADQEGEIDFCISYTSRWATW
jgi:hypothetical protein